LGQITVHGSAGVCTGVMKTVLNRQLLTKLSKRSDERGLQTVDEVKAIPEPRVMLIDFPEAVQDRISRLGYNVISGTFGRAFRAEPGSFVWFNHDLPLLHEQDIVFIDVEEPELDESTEAPDLPTTLSPDTKLCIVPGRQSYFNPRPFIASTSSTEFVDVVSQGGIIVAFAGRKRVEKYRLCTWGGVHRRGKEADNYSWTPTTVQVKNRQGKEVTFNESDIFGHLARSIKQPVYYSAVFQHLDPKRDYQIACNSLDEAVGFARQVEDGLLIFLPRFGNFGPVIEMMLKETLVDLAPKLFPHSTRHTWLLKSEYQWPQIRHLQKRREEIQEKYKSKLAELDQQIDAEREKLSFLHAMLRATGDSLVDSLAQVLRFIGFSDVRVMDQDKRQKEEDIQIWDNDQPILIEAKGLSGCPSEGDCQQILKYVVRRQRELDRTDVGGIFIVNHQRHVPGFERDPAFTPQQIDDATDNKYALTTTGDLFQAIIKVMKGLLEYADIRTALVSQIGRVEYIPQNYCEIGEIKHYYPEPCAALIELFDGQELKVGDSVGFLSEDQRFEQTAKSLEIDREPVEAVRSGIEFGLLVDQPVDKTFRLFRIEPR